jgi:hypothetical protein
VIGGLGSGGEDGRLGRLGCYMHGNICVVGIGYVHDQGFYLHQCVMQGLSKEVTL